MSYSRSPSFKKYDVLYVGRMWEHVHGLYGADLVSDVEILQVAGLCSGITRHIDNALWGSTEDGLHHVGVHASTWWVSNDDVRLSMLGDKVVCKDVLHVTSVEKGVGDAVESGVHLCILDGLRHIFDADDLTGMLGHEVGDGASAGIEVVDEGSPLHPPPTGGGFLLMPLSPEYISNSLYPGSQTHTPYH